MQRHLGEKAAPAERMPPIPESRMTPAQKQAAEVFLRERGELPRGPFVPLLRSPEVMVSVKALGDYLRFKSPLPANLRELAILITVRGWAQQFQWYHHEKIAAKAGLSAAVVQAVAEGRRPEQLNEREQIVYEFCTELLQNHCVSDPTYERTVEKLGEQNMIELVALAGYYTLNAMVLNVNRTAAPDGAPPALSPFPK